MPARAVLHGQVRQALGPRPDSYTWTTFGCSGRPRPRPRPGTGPAPSARRTAPPRTIFRATVPVQLRSPGPVHDPHPAPPEFGQQVVPGDVGQVTREGPDRRPALIRGGPRRVGRRAVEGRVGGRVRDPGDGRVGGGSGVMATGAGVRVPPVVHPAAASRKDESPPPTEPGRGARSRNVEPTVRVGRVVRADLRTCPGPRSRAIDRTRRGPAAWPPGRPARTLRDRPMTRFLGTTLVAALLAAPAPAQDWAKARLEKSPRHGEWVKIKHGDREVQAFVVYPEVKEKATAVRRHPRDLRPDRLGPAAWPTSWPRPGYIAIAPDLLSGAGPKGGGTDSFEAATTSGRRSSLPADQVTADLNAADRLRGQAAGVQRQGGGRPGSAGAAARRSGSPRTTRTVKARVRLLRHRPGQGRRRRAGSPPGVRVLRRQRRPGERHHPEDDGADEGGRARPMSR